MPDRKFLWLSYFEGNSKKHRNEKGQDLSRRWQQLNSSANAAADISSHSVHSSLGSIELKETT